jgi:predicted  nucleic acid-binding Zn-ribbon protein
MFRRCRAHVLAARIRRCPPAKSIAYNPPAGPTRRPTTRARREHGAPIHTGRRVTNFVATQIADLWRLQETDLALDSRRASLADAEARVGEGEELQALRARVDDLAASLRAAESAQRDVDAEAADLRAKITLAEEKLYGGSVRNPKELADLQADVESMKRHLAAVEDRDLEAMTAVEAAQRALADARAELEALEARVAGEQAELRARIDQLRAEIAVYERERAERAADVESDLLKKYEHLRRAHQGRAVARLDRNLCLGCRISLPANMVNRARAGHTLVQCPNCERILYA